MFRAIFRLFGDSLASLRRQERPRAGTHCVEDIFTVETDVCDAVYVRRPETEASLERALRSERCVILYGKPKCGKSTLYQRVVGKLSQGVPKLVTCSADWSYETLIQNMLACLGHTDLATTASKAGGKIKSPIGEIGGDHSETRQAARERHGFYTVVRDMEEKRVGIALEHFEKLPSRTRNKLAHDLSPLWAQECRPTTRLVIIGRGCSTNELLDFPDPDQIKGIRVAEMGSKDLRFILENGFRLLNVAVSDQLIDRIIDQCENSPLRCHRIAREMCIARGVEDPSPVVVTLTDHDFDEALAEVVTTPPIDDVPGLQSEGQAAISETAAPAQSATDDKGDIMAERKVSDTRSWSEAKVDARLDYVRKKYLDWDSTTGSARKWWEAFENENTHRRKLVLRLAEELTLRNATITEFFLAYVYSNTDNIQANLHYLDYTRLKKREERSRKAQAMKKELTAALEAFQGPDVTPLTGKFGSLLALDEAVARAWLVENVAALVSRGLGEGALAMSGMLGDAGGVDLANAVAQAVSAGIADEQGREAVYRFAECLKSFCEADQKLPPRAKAELLNAVAWTLLPPLQEFDRASQADQRRCQVARGLAELACQLTHHAHPALLDTLAHALHMSGEFAQALELQKRAIEAAEPGAMRDGLYENYKRMVDHA